MVTYVAPAEQKETYTLTGTGTHTLTEAQRSARVLTVLAEKILLSPPPQYFNFIYPEPQSFWGYCQWVYRDYISETLQLEYRRQVLLSSDWVEGERNRQLLCLIGVSQELAYLRLLDLMGIGGVPQEDRAVLYENWKNETAIQFLNQVRPETALWYEVTPGYGLQVTIIWRPHWEACLPLDPPVFLPPPRGTSKDEQRPAPGGGGQQPVTPPPMGRRDDPLSDSPAPPPDSPSGPPGPSPVIPPQPGNYRVNYQNRICVLNSFTGVRSMQVTSSFAVGPGPATLEVNDSGGSRAFRIRFTNGSAVTTISGAPIVSNPGCPEPTATVITSQVLVP
jgi:hypothetical protein